MFSFVVLIFEKEHFLSMCRVDCRSKGAAFEEKKLLVGRIRTRAAIVLFVATHTHTILCGRIVNEELPILEADYHLFFVSCGHEIVHQKCLSKINRTRLFCRKQSGE